MRQFASVSLVILFSLDASAQAHGKYRKPHLLSQATQAHQLRVLHAKELLGSTYNGSIVRSGEKIASIDAQIYQWTKEHLPKAHKKNYRRVAKTILEQSFKYKLDPVFLTAVIQGESSFNPDQTGPVGEIGLMQLRPETARWIGEKAKIPWKGEKALRNPVANIKYGAAYLDWLRTRFDSHAQLYLAAYNMGQRNVKNLLSRDVWPKQYPIHVMSRYVLLYTELQEKTKETSPIKKQGKKIARL